MAQVALRWLLQKPVVSSVIIGVTKMEQLDDNMAAANGWKLTDEEVFSPAIRTNVIWLKLLRNKSFLKKKN